MEQRRWQREVTEMQMRQIRTENEMALSKQLYDCKDGYNQNLLGHIKVCPGIRMP